MFHDSIAKNLVQRFKSTTADDYLSRLQARYEMQKIQSSNDIIANEFFMTKDGEKWFKDGIGELCKKTFNDLKKTVDETAHTESITDQLRKNLSNITYFLKTVKNTCLSETAYQSQRHQFQKLFENAMTVQKSNIRNDFEQEQMNSLPAAIKDTFLEVFKMTEQTNNDENYITVQETGKSKTFRAELPNKKIEEIREKFSQTDVSEKINKII